MPVIMFGNEVNQAVEKIAFQPLICYIIKIKIIHICRHSSILFRTEMTHLKKLNKYHRLILTALFVILTIVFLILKGVIVFDHSAQLKGDGIHWNNSDYVPCSGSYTEEKTIAKADDNWKINEVKEDKTHTFIVMRSFLDQYLLVKNDYKIPHSGKITTAHWGFNTISDYKFYTAVSDILDESVTNFEYETEDIFMLTDNQKMRELYVGYDNCPVATEYIGYMGIVDDTWYITTSLSNEQKNIDGSPRKYKVSCYAIPEKYIEVLNENFN